MQTTCIEPSGETVYSRALQRAAVILGGNDQLRAYLRVPMANLKLWLAGAEAPPADVFLKVVDLVFDHDLPRGPADPGSGKLQVRVGANAARCPSCDGVDFLVTAPGAAVNSLTVLKCSYCGREATRGDLVVRAADDAAKRGAAGVKRLMNQQAALKKDD